MKIASKACVALVMAIFCGLAARDCAAQTKDVSWPNYGNDAGGARYSEAQQINPNNVGQLKVAWTFRTGALDEKRWTANFI
jgi:glucose dehydrogenase